MDYVLNLYTTKKNDVINFFDSFYSKHDIDSTWNFQLHSKTDNNNNIYIYTKRTTNPLDFVVLLGALVDNDDKYRINPWLSLDKGLFIHITSNNLDSVIKYIYERFPY